MKQCPGNDEGLIMRNPGGSDSGKANRLPTTEEVQAMLQRDDDYDTKPFSFESNNSFRNILEGFANPNTGTYTNGE